jgi:hypothetical protein
MARAPLNTEEMMPKFEGLIDMTAASSLVAGEIVQVSQREFDAASLEYELFMKSFMVIRIHETADPKVAPAVAVAINGDRRWLPRGAPIKIGRAHVECLARSREMHLRTQDNPDRRADDGTIVRKHQTTPYGFEVLWDGEPKGRAWLERVLHETV